MVLLLPSKCELAWRWWSACAIRLPSQWTSPWEMWTCSLIVRPDAHSRPPCNTAPSELNLPELVVVLVSDALGVAVPVPLFVELAVGVGVAVVVRVNVGEGVLLLVPEATKILDCGVLVSHACSRYGRACRARRCAGP